MTVAIWALLVALASTPSAQAAGSEVGVLDSAGHETVLLCEPATCVGFALVDGTIVVLPE